LAAFAVILFAVAMPAPAEVPEVARPNLLTIVSIALVATAAADMVHEALGHGTISWLTGDRILSLSTVAIQNATANRFVAAAGTSANFLVGAISFLLLRRVKSFGVLAYFLWIFGALNLLNCGYLVTSAVLNSGDWAYVIVGLSPSFVWRILLGVVGVLLYIVSVRWAARSLLAFVEKGEVAVRDVQGLVVPAYVAGGALMTLASVFNPISPSLILLSGVGASFGLNCGLLMIPEIVAGKARNPTPVTGSIPLSPIWLALALVIAISFIAILGPGIRF
jgi:hypothetical protein